MNLHVDPSTAGGHSSADASAISWQEAFWRELPTEALSTLEKSQTAQLESLRQERDPEIFSNYLLHFAAGREREGRHDLALLLYQKISEFPAAPPKDRHRAEKRAAALRGEGQIGARTEVLLSRLIEEGMSPAPIVAMGIAGSAFKLGRALSLNVLRNAPLGLNFARFGANGFGLLTESAAFTASAKGVSQALGQSQDWSTATFNKEWFAATLMLSSLKAGSAIGYQGARSLAQVAGQAPSYALSQSLVLAAKAAAPLGLFGGILIGHKLETSLGLRPAQDGATAMIDGLATMFHLYVGGRLAQGLGAARLTRAATELEWRIGNLPKRSLGFPDIFSRTPVLAVAGRSGDLLRAKNSPASEPLQMSALSWDRAPAFGLDELREVSSYAKKLEGSTDSLLRFFFQNYSELAQTQHQHRFLLLLSRTWVGHQSVLLDNAIHTLIGARHAEAAAPTSSYANWLTKLAFEKSLRDFDPQALDSILTFLGRGGRVSDLEMNLGPMFPEADISKGPPPAPVFWQGLEWLNRHIRHFPLSAEAKVTLQRWAQATVKNPRTPFTDSGFQLINLLDYHLGVPGRAEQVDRALWLAARSPFGLARIERLRTVLETGLDAFKPLKLAELSDPHATIFGLNHSWSSPESTKASQSNAYLGELAPRELISEMKRLEPELTDPVATEVRLTRRRQILEELFPEGARPEHMERGVLSMAFRRLGDPFSLQLAEALSRGDFGLEILPDRAFKTRASEFSEIEVTESAFYFHWKKLMLIRMPELKNYSHDSSRNAFFEVMGMLVHEYRHHLDIQAGERRTPMVHLHQEMSGHFTEYLWKAQHGDTHQFSIFTKDVSLGPAMRFHDYYEQAYGHWWAKNTPAQDAHRAARQGP